MIPGRFITAGVHSTDADPVMAKLKCQGCQAPHRCGIVKVKTPNDSEASVFWGRVLTNTSDTGELSKLL